MQRLFLLSCVFLLSCSAIKPTDSTVPNWYAQRITPKNSQHLVLGFGQGVNQKIAKERAIAEIAESIHVAVKSATQVNDTLIRVQNEEQFKSTFTKDIKLSTEVVLSHVKRLRSICKAQQCYSLYGFDSRALAMKLSNFKPCSPDTKHNVLKNRLPIQKYTQHCPWTLNYRQQAWYMDINQQSVRLTEKDFYDSFFFSSNSDALDFTIQPAPILKAGEYYSVQLSPKKSGYLSLFYVSEKGQVQALFVNEYRKKSKYMIFPDLHHYEGLVAENNVGTQSVRDMLLGILCNRENILLKNFMPVSDESVSNDNLHAFTYGKLLEQGLAQDCTWSSQFVYIK